VQIELVINRYLAQQKHANTAPDIHKLSLVEIAFKDLTDLSDKGKEFF
jgi:hypothetical protein